MFPARAATITGRELPEQAFRRGYAAIDRRPKGETGVCPGARDRRPASGLKPQRKPGEGNRARRRPNVPRRCRRGCWSRVAPPSTLMRWLFQFSPVAGAAEPMNELSRKKSRWKQAGRPKQGYWRFRRRRRVRSAQGMTSSRLAALYVFDAPKSAASAASMVLSRVCRAWRQRRPRWHHGSGQP
jgi:hypothetical protein